jgi:hypothetical protein
MRSGRELGEARRKCLVDAIECAIREQNNDVAGFQLGRNSVDDCVAAGVQLGVCTSFMESLNHIFGVQAFGIGNALLLVDTGEDDAVSEKKALDQVGLKNLAAESVGAGFQHRPNAAGRVNGPECPEGFADGGGVVSEVVNDGNSVDNGADFKPPFDGFEGGEG